MKKRLTVPVLVLCLLLSLFVSGCGEKNTQETQPDQNGTENTTVPTEQCAHIWQDATCTAAKVCTACHAAEGEPLGHSYGDWLPNGDGTHTRSCQRDDSHTESAPCFGGNAPEEGESCADCGYTYDPVHVHTYDRKVVAGNYKASDATCSQAAGYYLSCSCGLAGTEVFRSGQPLAHTEVIDEAKHATFSVTGLTEGAHCTVCGAVTKAQTVVPALGSDVVAGTDYYDKEGQTTYRYSYSFTMYENDRFNLTTLKVGSDESYQLTGEEGKLNYLDNGIYELVFDSGRERMYGKIVDGKFEFCNKDGSKWADQDERPQGSTAVAITPRPGNSVYGYNDLAGNAHGKSMQELYYRLYAACEAFADSRDNVRPTDGLYVIDRINLDYYVLTADEAVAVWKVFYVENPRYYWLANTVQLTGGTLQVCIDPAYAQAAYRGNCDAAIDAMAAECAAKLTSGMDQLKKAMTIHDYVLGRMNYAYKSDGVTPETAIWAHNMIGCAEKKSGVCEAYAKTYQYLCRLNGLDCIVVTGYNGESHAWNMTKIDGKWYGVDCTFDETNTDDVSYNCFGMSAERMNSDYTADQPGNSGINYLYQLPQLAQQGIELVDLYKAGTLLGTYANIDAAFAAMTDANGEYTLQLHYYERKGVLLLSAAAVEHHITATQTPAVKSITICGQYTDAGNGYATNMNVYVDHALTLRSDLTADGIHIFGQGSLDITSHCLKIIGDFSFISVPVKGSMDDSAPSEIVVDTRTTVEFQGGLEVYTLNQQSDTGYVLFRRDTHIAQAHAHFLQVFDDCEAKINVRIDRFYPLSLGDYRSRNNILVEGPARVSVGAIEGEGQRVDVELKFGKLEEFAEFSVGSIDGSLKLILTGIRHYSMTDASGNEVNSWLETIDPRLLNGPVATLGDLAIFDTMKIYISQVIDANAYMPYDNTYLFCVNSQGQVVYR